MFDDEWCVREELKYLGGSLEIYMPAGIDTLHEKLIADIDEYFEDKPQYLTVKEHIIEIIDKRFGGQK
jgi:hypothetical protein